MHFVACLVFLGMAFSFIKLISSSDTLTKREAAILKICPPAIITSAEVIIAEYDAILDQGERENFYNHLSNYTNEIIFDFSDIITKIHPPPPPHFKILDPPLPW